MPPPSEPIGLDFFVVFKVEPLTAKQKERLWGIFKGCPLQCQPEAPRVVKEENRMSLDLVREELATYLVPPHLAAGKETEEERRIRKDKVRRERRT